MIWLERDDMRDDVAWRGMISGMIWFFRDDMGDDMGFQG